MRFLPQILRIIFFFPRWLIFFFFFGEFIVSSRKYNARVKSQAERLPLTCFPWPSHILSMGFWCYASFKNFGEALHYVYYVSSSFYYVSSSVTLTSLYFSSICVALSQIGLLSGWIKAWWKFAHFMQIYSLLQSATDSDAHQKQLWHKSGNCS